MKPIAIVTDSTCDLPASLVHALQIHVVPCNVHFGTEMFREGIDLNNEQFFQRLRTSPELPKTSQPSVGAFLEVYQPLATRASAIVSVHLAGKLSGTLQSATLAAKEITGIPIATIDSGSCSMGIGWLAVIAARAAQAGQEFDSIVRTVTDARERLRVLALLENLTNVLKGGRLGKAEAMLGTMFSVKPIIAIDHGEVKPVEKIRTWGRAVSRLAEMTQLFAPCDEVAVLHAQAPGEAEALAARLSAFHPRDRMVVTEVGAVLGTHTGVGAVGIAVVQSAPHPSA
ncbi:MAG: DegV family protein [Chloroflexi bacterium]|nr:DegV family protein [Chloroflexota bacterium]